MKPLLLLLLSCFLVQANAQKRGIQRWILKHEAKQLTRQFNAGQKLKIEWFDSTGEYELKARLVDFRVDELVVKNLDGDTLHLPGKQIRAISFDQKRFRGSQPAGGVAVAAGIGGMVALGTIGIVLLLLLLAYVFFAAIAGDKAAKESGCLVGADGGGCLAGSVAVLAVFGLGFWMLTPKTVKTEQPFSNEWVLEKDPAPSPKADRNWPKPMP